MTFEHAIILNLLCMFACVFYVLETNRRYLMKRLEEAERKLDQEIRTRRLFEPDHDEK